MRRSPSSGTVEACASGPSAYPTRYARSITFLMPALAPARIAAVLRDSPRAIRQVISPRYCGSDREWKFSIFFWPRPRPSDTEDRRVEHVAALEDLRRRRPRAFSTDGFSASTCLRQALDERAVGEDLERRPRLAPPARHDVVLEVLEIDVAHFGQHVPGKVDRERAGAQQVVVRIVGMTSDVGAQREIDRLGEHVLKCVVTRDRDREAAGVDRKAVLVEDPHALEEVIARAAGAATAPRSPCAATSRPDSSRARCRHR